VRLEHEGPVDIRRPFVRTVRSSGCGSVRSGLRRCDRGARRCDPVDAGQSAIRLALAGAIVASVGAIELMLVSAIRLTLTGAIAASAGAIRARGAGATQVGHHVTQRGKLAAREFMYRYELRR
jgi:hypothetical protein